MINRLPLFIILYLILKISCACSISPNTDDIRQSFDPDKLRQFIRQQIDQGETPKATPPAAGNDDDKEARLKSIVQEIFLAQAQVQLEANEIEKAQSIAITAQEQLEEGSTNVRVINQALHVAQENVAESALRAQSAQLQLAAHDQLLFTARQRVDSLSAEMVGLQAELGVRIDTRDPIDVASLINRLKQPLTENQRPTASPVIRNPDLH